MSKNCEDTSSRADNVGKRRGIYNSIRQVVRENSGTVIGVYNEYKATPARFYPLIVVILLLAANYFLISDAYFLELRYHTRGERVAHPDLVIVGLDEQYVREYGTPAITPKDYLARLVEIASRSGAGVIGLDFYLEESDPGYSELERAIREAGNVVLPIVREEKEKAYSISVGIPDSLSGLVLTGFSNLEYPVAKHIQPLAYPFDSSDFPPVPSFALSIMAYWHLGDSIRTEDVYKRWDTVLGLIKYPFSGTEEVPINYYRLDIPENQTLLRAEEAIFYDTLGEEGKSRLDGMLKDKLVLIGATYKESDEKVDTFETPYGEVQGAMIHAAIISNMLHKKYLRAIGPGLSFLLYVLIVFVGFIIEWRIHKFEKKYQSGMQYSCFYWHPCCL